MYPIIEYAPNQQDMEGFNLTNWSWFKVQIRWRNNVAVEQSNIQFLL